MDGLLQDIRYAFRTMRRAPGTTLLALATLALAIGLNSSVFTLVNAISFRPLPYPDSDQLLELFTSQRSSDQAVGVSAPDARDWQARAHTLRGIAVYQEQSFSVWLGESAEITPGMRATANLLGVLGVAPMLGRGLLPEDQRPGAPAVTVIAHTMWRDRFGSDPRVLGRRIRIDGSEHEIVGVMPEYFGFVDFARFWIPLNDALLQDRAQRNLQAIARLADGATRDDAGRELGVISTQLAGEYPGSNTGWSAVAVTLESTRSEPFFSALIVAVLLVLLIACANVGNLILARGAARQGEFAVRLMIGAGRRRVLRQLVTESAVLATAGAGLGLIVSLWGTDLLVAVLPTDQMPLWIDFGMDFRVISYTIAVVVIAVLTFGLAPALTILRQDVSIGARTAARRTSAGLPATRLRNGLIIGEVALCFVLLAAAGALLRSALNTANATPGYDPAHILSLRVPLSDARYGQEPERQRYIAEALHRLTRVNGAQQVGASATLPVSRVMDAANTGAGVIVAEGDADAGTPRPRRLYSAVTANFFSTLNLPILRGRAFTESDRAGSAAVAVISESLARLLWPAQDAVGRRVKLAPVDKQAEWLTVIGVVADHYDVGRGEGGPPRRARAELYVPIAQGAGQDVVFLLRGGTETPMAMARTAQRALQPIDIDQPITDVTALSDLIYENVRVQRWLGGLAGTFAALALLLSAIGLFGVIAYSVLQRQHEIGIRMALGARPADVVVLLVRLGSRLLAWGLGIGLIAALVVSQFLAAVVFGASARDPLTLGVVAVLLGAVALLASWLPARRAARVEPVRAMAGS